MAGGGIDIKRAYAALDVPASRYIFQAAGAFAVSIGFVLVLLFLFPTLFSGIFFWLLFIIPIYGVMVPLMYPYLLAEQRKSKINQNIHYFVAHMSVLATTGISRTDVMELLGKKKEYGPLAEDAEKLHTLVTVWNMSLPEACRFSAQRSPSLLWSDFLERFAFSIDSGEDLETFLKAERDVLMSDFSALYKSGLYELENLKNVFQSIMMSLVFIFIVLALMPVISGTDATPLLGGALAMGSFMELSIVYWVKAKAPADPIWQPRGLDPESAKKVNQALTISIAAAITLTFAILVVLTLGLGINIPVAIIMAIGLTPLLYTGHIVTQVEEKVKRRDDNFPAFMRTLGASTSARGGLVKDSLHQIQFHDFGPLTGDIRALYSRVVIRVNDELAWDMFSQECGSNLIEKFSRMFIEGVKSGGEADQIGRIISNIFVTLVTLRKSRFQTAGNLKGLMYGLVFGMSFSLYISLGIIGMLSNITNELNLGDAENVPFSSFLSFTINLELISFLILLFLLLHAIASSVMIAIAFGGHWARSYNDMPKMVWVVAIISVVAEAALEQLL